MEKEKLLENFACLLFDPDEIKSFYAGKGKIKETYNIKVEIMIVNKKKLNLMMKIVIG